MRKVVDSNMLQSPDLADYLEKPHRYVVLPDYVSMEMYKPEDTVQSLRQRLEILIKHPKQVLVLKGTIAMGMLRGRRSGLVRRMIDQGQTRDFQSICTMLEAAERGEPDVLARIQHLNGVARSNIGRIQHDVSRLIEAFKGIQNTYSEDEIRALRTGKPLPDEFYDKLAKHTLLLAGNFFRDHPGVQKLPSFDEAVNTLLFRVALCVHMYIFDWIAKGSGDAISEETLRNDMVDLIIAAYSTFFDGLLSNDKKQKRILELSSAAMKGLFSTKTN